MHTASAALYSSLTTTFSVIFQESSDSLIFQCSLYEATHWVGLCGSVWLEHSFVICMLFCCTNIDLPSELIFGKVSSFRWNWHHCAPLLAHNDGSLILPLYHCLFADCDYILWDSALDLPWIKLAFHLINFMYGRILIYPNGSLYNFGLLWHRKYLSARKSL